MAWKYRPDELSVLCGYGVPTAAQSEKCIYVDLLTGQSYLNQGSGSTTYTPAATSNVETLTAARVLTMADSGKKFFLALVGGFDITLPALATSANFTAEFIVGISPTTAYTITGATADKIYGYVLSASGAAEDTAGVGDPGDVVNFVASTAVIGDRVKIDSNGTVYIAKGECAAAGGITITG